MFTATALMDNIAATVKGKLRFTNREQTKKLLTRRPRNGWYL